MYLGEIHSSVSNILYESLFVEDGIAGVLLELNVLSFTLLIVLQRQETLVLGRRGYIRGEEIEEGGKF